MKFLPTLSRSAGILAAVALLFALSANTHADSAAPAATGGISGKIVDPSNSPAAGVTVKLFEAPAATAHHPKGAKPAAALGVANGQTAVALKAGGKKPALQETTTAADGTFSFTNVPAGNYLIVALEKGVGGAHQRIAVAAGNPVQVNLALKAHKAGGKHAAKAAQ